MFNNNPKNSNHAISPQYFPVDIKSPEEPYSEPTRVAELVQANENTFAEASKFVEIYVKARRDSNPVLETLTKTIENTERAIYIMSGLGYTTFRHLQAAGHTLPEIASSIEINLLDLIAFLSSHKDAEKHAELDADCCADTIMHNLMIEIRNCPMKSKFEGDKLKNLVYATELLVKRLSAKWVGQYRAGIDEAGVGIGAGMVFNVSIGNVNNNTQNNNYCEAQQEAAHQLKQHRANNAIEHDDNSSLGKALNQLDALPDE